MQLKDVLDSINQTHLITVMHYKGGEVLGFYAR